MLAPAFRSQHAAVAAIAILYGRYLLDVVATKRNDAGVADRHKPVLVLKLRARSSAGSHLACETEAQLPLLPTDQQHAAQRHTEHAKRQDSPQQDE